jgi:D-xylulose reductase
MEALVLERKDELSLRDFPIEEKLEPRDVRIALRTVGVCGSDVHYYTHGAIGPFVVNEPMILGHEAAGEIVEVGSAVKELKPGDRVCMEPGIPAPTSRAARLGKYNLDPAVRFWATPPVHGVLRPTVVHPADFTFKLPDHVSYAEGAMVEPLAVGVHAATKVQVQPGDLAVVIGAGPIGIVTILAALAAGCSRVIVSDIHEPKLELARKLGPVLPVNVRSQQLKYAVRREIDGWGRTCSSSAQAMRPLWQRCSISSVPAER